MAHQSTPDVVDFACQTVADLTVLPRTALSDGCRSWVSVAGATHGLWCLDDNSVALVDNLTVVATSDGVGRWIYFGFAATPAANISVNTEALLSAVNVVALLDGALAWVGNPAGGVGQSQDSTWQLVTQVTALPALLAHEVIASSAAGRVWQRQLVATTARWLQQAAWFVSAAAGDDQNDGNTNGTALASYAEYIRRVPYLYVPQTVNILDTLPDSDNLVHSPEVRWHQGLSGTQPTLTVTGTRVLAAAEIVAASTDEVANAAPTITVAAAVWVEGTILQVVAGANVGATAVVVRDLTGGVARTTPWRSAAGARVAPPALNDTISRVTLPTVNIVNVQLTAFTTLPPSFNSLNIKGINRTVSAFFTVCSFAGAQNIAATSNGGFHIYSGCSITTSGATASTTGGSTTFYTLCGFAKPTVGAQLWAEGARGSFSACVIERWRINVGDIGGPGGFVDVSSLGIFDNAAASTAVKVERGGRLSIGGTLYGPDPTGASVGTDVREGGHVDGAAAVTPTLTAATELLFENAATAIPELVAGAVVPNAAALNNWGAGAGGWSAATFARNVMSYKTGSAISDHV